LKEVAAVFHLVIARTAAAKDLRIRRIWSRETSGLLSIQG
jgi:hypothetical protein